MNEYFRKVNSDKDSHNRCERMNKAYDERKI